MNMTKHLNVKPHKVHQQRYEMKIMNSTLTVNSIKTAVSSQAAIQRIDRK